MYLIVEKCGFLRIDCWTFLSDYFVVVEFLCVLSWLTDKRRKN